MSRRLEVAHLDRARGHIEAALWHLVRGRSRLRRYIRPMPEVNEHLKQAIDSADTTENQIRQALLAMERVVVPGDEIAPPVRS